MCTRSYEGFVVSGQGHGDEADRDCAGFCWEGGLVRLAGRRGFIGMRRK